MAAVGWNRPSSFENWWCLVHYDRQERSHWPQPWWWYIKPCQRWDLPQLPELLAPPAVYLLHWAGRFLFVLLLYVAAAVVLPEGALISMLDNNNYQDPCDVACHYMALQMTKCWTEFDSPLSSLSILFPSLKYLSIYGLLGKKDKFSPAERSKAPVPKADGCGF